MRSLVKGTLASSLQLVYLAGLLPGAPCFQLACRHCAACEHVARAAVSESGPDLEASVLSVSTPAGLLAL